MLIRQLEYFVAVAREQHFGRAADACYVSQPALSTAIVKLERELNVTLINRGQHFQGLTPAGARLVGRASQLLEDHHQFKAIAAALNSGISDTLRLGTGPTVSSTTTAELVAQFCASHPAANVQVSSSQTSEELLQLLRDSELDTAISHFETRTPIGLIVTPLYKERYVLVTGSSLVPNTRTITWARAATLPLALPKRATGSRKLIDSTFASVGATPEPRIEADSFADLYAHAATGEYASVVPRSWLRVMSATTATSVVDLIEPDTMEEISIAVNSVDPSVAGQTFLDVVTHRDSEEILGFDRTRLIADLRRP